MAKFKNKKRRPINDDGFTYLILDKFTQNIGILFGSPKSIVQLEGENDAPKTLVYESTLQYRKWGEIKRNLLELWNSIELAEDASIKEVITIYAKHQNCLELPEIQSLLNNPDVSEYYPAKLQDLFNLASTLFNDGHQLIAIETIGTLNPSIKANHSGGTSQFISQEFSQTISIVDFTLYALALREALSNKRNNEAAEIIYDKIKSLLAGVHDQQLKAQLYRELGLALIDKASETSIKEGLH